MEPTKHPVDDPRSCLAAAITETGRIAANVTVAQHHAPTPCDGIDVGLLMAHLEMVLRRIGAAGRGEAPATWPTDEVPSEPGRWAALWSASAEGAIDAWGDDAKLDRPAAIPWGTFPGSAVIDVYTSEIVVHGWDLARATGQEPQFDEVTIDRGFSMFRQQMPAEGRQEILDAVASISPPGTEGPFHLAKDAPEDAPLLDQLIAWSGRDPAWQSA